jgi:hypothetical protein
MPASGRGHYKWSSGSGKVWSWQQVPGGGGKFWMLPAIQLLLTTRFPPVIQLLPITQLLPTI